MEQRWEQEGIMVLEGFFKDEADVINTEIDHLLDLGSVRFNFTGNKIVFANKESQLIEAFTRDDVLTDVLSYLVGRKVLPFQTINFYYGSEQNGAFRLNSYVDLA